MFCLSIDFIQSLKERFQQEAKIRYFGFIVKNKNNVQPLSHYPRYEGPFLLASLNQYNIIILRQT